MKKAALKPQIPQVHAPSDNSELNIETVQYVRLARTNSYITNKRKSLFSGCQQKDTSRIIESSMENSSANEKQSQRSQTLKSKRSTKNKTNIGQILPVRSDQ